MIETKLRSLAKNEGIRLQRNYEAERKVDWVLREAGTKSAGETRPSQTAIKLLGVLILRST